MTGVFSRLRIGLSAVLAGLFLGGCAATKPAPALVISPGDVTYVKVIPAPQIVGIAMPQVSLPGAGGIALSDSINKGTMSGSQRFYNLVKDDPRTQALQRRFRDRVILEAKEAGLVLEDGDDLDVNALPSNRQVIFLRGLSVTYLAKTMAHSYRPYALTSIDSSRDPATPIGERRSARVAFSSVEDDKYAFATADGIFNDLNRSLDGVNAVVDALAKQVVQQLVSAKGA
ncbi:hypothetical protein [Ralstonia sp. 24A2]|uniref:hypothetical protein n=1 Tax=Ralstonia sp. 24A2 TaxID=3447364 RepID=UPI003F6A011B